ncbi:MAG TPA: hypothetical protein VE825_06345 [Terriglobales bacterium]|jgi:hypothetical protein|nr:hypothetical protein [Terriglobales bacterium]
MAIIISRKGSATAQVIEKCDFEREHNLQEYIHEHPESIPVYEIKEDKRLLVVAREFPTESGPIDALAIDKDGDIYIVETKLYRNPDKRTVVAQALDYGASLWKHMPDFGQFRNHLEESSQSKWKMGLEEKLQSFFSLDDSQIELLLDALKRNLHDGRLKFVILMDTIEDRLKDLITYVNQNSQFDIFAVQLEYYRHEDYEIMIPRLFGAEVKKEPGSDSGTIRRKWDEAAVLADARQKLSDEDFAAFDKLYRFAKDTADQINFGTGSYGAFSPIFRKLSNKSLFTLGSEKRLSFNFDWVANDNLHTAEAFKTAMERIGFKFQADWRVTRPSVSSAEWRPRADAFMGALKKLLG